MTWQEYCLSKLDYAKLLYNRIMKKKWDFNNPQTFTYMDFNRNQNMIRCYA